MTENWTDKNSDPVVLIVDWKDIHYDENEVDESRFEVCPAYWVCQEYPYHRPDDGYWTASKPEDQPDRELIDKTWILIFATLGEAQKMVRSIRKTYKICTQLSGGNA